MSHPRTNLTEFTSTESHRLSASPTANQSDDVTRGVDVIANVVSLAYPEGDHSEDGRDLLERHVTPEWPTSKDTDVLGKLNSPGEREDSATPKPEVTRFRDFLEGHSQETLKLNEEFIAVIQRWEHEFREQERLVLETRVEVSLLQEENKKLRERNTKLNALEEKVAEVQEIVCKMKVENGHLLMEVKNLSAFRCDNLGIEVGKTFCGLLRDKQGLTENLRKCQTELASSTQRINSKSHDIEELKGANLILEAANAKLEQKSEQIQQQLCKERVGQHGSYVDGQQTPSLLESTAKDMFSSIAVFSSLLSKYKDRKGNNEPHDFVVRSDLFKRVRIARERHWTYLLREHICSTLFDNFHSETFTRSRSEVLYLDDEERRRKCFEYFKNCKQEGARDRAISQTSNNDNFYEVFLKYFTSNCNEKFDELFLEYFTSMCYILLPCDIQYLLNDVELVRHCLHERLSSLFPDRLTLVQGLIVAAGKVWQFHKLCFSFEPPATMFRVSNGDLFNEGYMESIDAPENDDGSSVPKVAFMTYPGFRLRKSIIKCEVYLAIDT